MHLIVSLLTLALVVGHAPAVYAAATRRLPVLLIRA